MLQSRSWLLFQHFIWKNERPRSRAFVEPEIDIDDIAWVERFFKNRKHLGVRHNHQRLSFFHHHLLWRTTPTDDDVAQLRRLRRPWQRLMDSLRAGCQILSHFWWWHITSAIELCKTRCTIKAKGVSQKRFLAPTHYLLLVSSNIHPLCPGDALGLPRKKDRQPHA